MISLKVACLIGMVSLFNFAYAMESGLVELDPEVFKALKNTPLRTHTGMHAQDDIVMHYVLTKNKIDDISGVHGMFKIENGELHAKILDTKSVLTGTFHTSIRRRTVKKAPKLPIQAKGTYLGKLFNSTVTLTMKMPSKENPRQPMNLTSCVADVLGMELDLTSRDQEDNKSLAGLKYWLRDAMLPTFSRLFCDAMTKILKDGMNSKVVRALLNRMCQLRGPGNCPFPTPPPNMPPSEDIKA